MAKNGVYERRVNDLYFMPFFFIRVVFYPLAYARPSHALVACLLARAFTFGSVSTTDRRLLAALVLITHTHTRLPTTSMIST